MTGRYDSEHQALREAREAVIARYRVALEDDWRKALPRLLDELDAIDREHLAAAVKAAVKVAKPEIEKTLGRTRTPAAETAAPVKPATRRRART